MKKVRNITFITGIVILAFGLLARYIPGISITDFAWGVCVGSSAVLIIAALGFAVTPVFCRKKKEDEQIPESGK